MAPSQRIGASDGAKIIDLAVLATVVFVLTAVAATIVPDLLRWPAVTVAVGLFAVGCVIFLAAFVRAVDRSRTETLHVAGIWFMANSAPAPVRRMLLGCAVVQTVVAVTTAAIRPFTTLAFGILVPMFGLGMAGLWSAKYGTFADRALTDRERGALNSSQPSGETDG